MKASDGNDGIGGPKLMAPFILKEVQKQIEQKLLSLKLAVPLLKEEPNQTDEVAIIQPPTTPTATTYIAAQENTILTNGAYYLHDNNQEYPAKNSTIDEPSIPTVQLACKICRCILFCQNDLKNPPHEKGRMKKDYSNTFRKRSCESMFLANPIFTMNNDNVGKMIVLMFR